MKKWKQIKLELHTSNFLRSTISQNEPKTVTLTDLFESILVMFKFKIDRQMSATTTKLQISAKIYPVYLEIFSVHDNKALAFA